MQVVVVLCYCKCVFDKVNGDVCVYHIMKDDVTDFEVVNNTYIHKAVDADNEDGDDDDYCDDDDDDDDDDE